MIEEAKLIEILGIDRVSRDHKLLHSYSCDMSFVNTTQPEYLVKPRNSEDIQKLVRLARETRTPLVPVSSGPPHFRGDTVPSAGGAVIVDLSGMKQIIMVHRNNRSAMFEPGVTFAELIAAVAQEGLRLNLPLLPRQTKSVVGSLLEREPVVMPKYHWDIGDPTNCYEVIFGTGDIFRTGAAAGPGSIEEQWAAGGSQKEAAGPSSSSWYRVIQGAQGTMGIVSWATARCELIPSREESFVVGDSQLDKILELAYWLNRLRLVNECFILNNTNLAAILAGRWPGDFAELKGKLPAWVFFFTVAAYEYLQEKRMQGQLEDLGNLAQRSGLSPATEIGGISAAAIAEMVKHPSAEPYWKLRYKGACQDIFFITTLEKHVRLIETIYCEAGKAGYPASDIGIYIQPLVQGSNYHCEFNLFYNSAKAAEVERVKQLTAAAIPQLIAAGGFFSRPYAENARLIMNRDAATVGALLKVKSILDPDNILNPGKLCF
jgi:hypothetical protein